MNAIYVKLKTFQTSKLISSARQSDSYMIYLNKERQCFQDIRITWK